MSDFKVETKCLHSGSLALIQKWETTQKAIEEEIEARKKKQFVQEKIPRQLYFSTIYNWREVRCESMSNVIVKENETLDSALRRFKRSCAKAGIQQEIRKREHYEKPSVRRKKKSEAARKRKYN